MRWFRGSFGAFRSTYQYISIIANPKIHFPTVGWSFISAMVDMVFVGGSKWIKRPSKSTYLRRARSQLCKTSNYGNRSIMKKLTKTVSSNAQHTIRSTKPVLATFRPQRDDIHIYQSSHGQLYSVRPRWPNQKKTLILMSYLWQQIFEIPDQ